MGNHLNQTLMSLCSTRLLSKVYVLGHAILSDGGGRFLGIFVLGSKLP